MDLDGLIFILNFDFTNSYLNRSLFLVKKSQMTVLIYLGVEGRGRNSWVQSTYLSYFCQFWFFFPVLCWWQPHSVKAVILLDTLGTRIAECNSSRKLIIYIEGYQFYSAGMKQFILCSEQTKNLFCSHKSVFWISNLQCVMSFIFH